MIGRSLYNFSTGDLVALREGVHAAAVYADNQPFKFGAFLFTAGFMDTGVVLSRVSDNDISVLHYYVRVIFDNGKIGIIVADNLKIVQSFVRITQKS